MTQTKQPPENPGRFKAALAGGVLTFSKVSVGTSNALKTTDSKWMSSMSLEGGRATNRASPNTYATVPDYRANKSRSLLA
jgi:hypothetical protein